MKTRKLTRITSILLSLLAIFSLVPSQTVLAANNTIFVTPSSQSMQPGTIFTVQVKGSLSGNTFMGPTMVSGTLTFPKNLLKVNSVSQTGATFNWQMSATPDNNNGTVVFSQRSFFPVADGAVHIMAITFQALANGSAPVGFNSSTTYASNGSAITTSRSGGTYTVSTPTCPAGQTGTPPNCTTPPTPTCPAGQVGTPPNCTTPPTPTCPSGQTGTPPNCKPVTNPNPSNPTPPKPPSPSNPSTSPQTPDTPSSPVPSPDITPDTTPDDGFSITDVTTTRSYDTAMLNWKTNTASKTTVSFGTSLKDLSKNVEATRLPDESYEAKLPELTPGKQYYYTISSTSEADPTKTDSYSGVFTTRGFPVVITITENKNQATNAKIKIGEQNYSTDRSGKISIELATGSYNVEVKTATSSKAFALTVAKKTIPSDGSTPETQRFAFDIPAAGASTSSNGNLLLLVGSLVGGGLLLGGFLFLAWKRRREQDNQPTALVASDTDYSWSQPQQPLPQAFPQDQYNQNIPAPEQTYAAPPPDTTAPPIAPEPTAETLDTQQEEMPVQEIPQPEVTSLPQQDPIAQLPYTEPEQPTPVTPDQVYLPQEEVAQQPQVAYQDVPQPDTAYEQPQVAQAAEEPVINQEQVAQPAEIIETGPAAEVVQTPNGSELQINHADRHNSVYINEDEPQDMFEAAKK